MSTRRARELSPDWTKEPYIRLAMVILDVLGKFIKLRKGVNYGVSFTVNVDDGIKYFRVYEEG